MKIECTEQCDLISSVSIGLQMYNFSTVWLRKPGGQSNLHLHLIEKKTLQNYKTQERKNIKKSA